MKLGRCQILMTMPAWSCATTRTSEVLGSPTDSAAIPEHGCLRSMATLSTTFPSPVDPRTTGRLDGISGGGLVLESPITTCFRNLLRFQVALSHSQDR